MGNEEDEAEQDGAPLNDDYATSNPTKFRFKAKRSRSPEHDLDGTARRHAKRRDRSLSTNPNTHRRQRHHHHRHYGSERRKKAQAPVDDPSLYDDTYLPNAKSDQYLDPDAAFRESLFDALADDEGADYWENVYGQPIHTYPNTKLGPDGELERMTGDEYACYVRGRMYEKTHQHVIEERSRREEARRRQKAWHEKAAHMEAEKEAFDKRVEESLRRGEERKRVKQLKEAWGNYQQRWKELQSLGSTAEQEQPTTPKDIRSLLPWPVSSGKWKEVSREGLREEVEKFFRTAPQASNASVDLAAVLKAERVRWHPDKVQQRYGFFGIDAEVMRAVTAVFQVIDKLWNEMRERRGRH